MVSLSKYCSLVSLSASGKLKIKEIDSAKKFLIQQVAVKSESSDVSDLAVQQRLWELTCHRSEFFVDEQNCLLAEFCLRCYLSHQIELVCIQLEQQFGREYAFNRYDLFSLVLDDTPDQFRTVDPQANPGAYQSLSQKILATFNPQKASLSTWMTRLVKQHRELNLFLLEKGVYLVSNWAILNDTSNKQLKRILVKFHGLTEEEIVQATLLLDSYHAIYRQERLKQRQSGGAKGKCQPPSEDQLEKIALLIRQKSVRQLTPEATLFQLQELAELLRQYRLHIRGGKAIAQQSLDAPETNVDRLQAASFQEANDEQEQLEFLQAYRQQFLSCLNSAIETVIESKYRRLIKKGRQKGQHYLTALDLFHCQGKSMGEIAPFVDLTAQYQVTRLLKLKELRVDVRHKLLQELSGCVRDLAAKYHTPEHLQQLDAQLQDALVEQIDVTLQEAETEASIAKERACGSVFSRQLCQYLRSR